MAPWNWNDDGVTLPGKGVKKAPAPAKANKLKYPRKSLLKVAPKAKALPLKLINKNLV